MAKPLKFHLWRQYWGRGENLTREQIAFTHLTLFAGRPYAEVLHPGPRAVILGCPYLPASIHLYDIAKGSFILALRNIPMSVGVERFVLKVGGEVDNGRMHTTTRLELRPSDGPLVRALADLVRRVPRKGRIDRFAGAGSESFVVYQALWEFAGVLETFDPSAIEIAEMVVCQRK
jgi:hypothetical protein